MKRWYPFTQLFISRLRTFYREPIALFWVYGFPLILALGLGIAFANREPEPATVDVQDGTSEAQRLYDRLKEAGFVVELHSAEDCRRRLDTGRAALYVVPGGERYEYCYDKYRSDSVLARYRVDSEIQRWKAGERAWPTDDVLTTELGSRYIDFLMPGLIGLNLMGGGLWGVGFVVVDMRIRRLLKRLLATPMRRSDFMLSILAGRLVLMLPDMLVLLGVAILGFQVPVRGSALALTLVILAGASAFAGIGLLIASRTDKTETVSGLMNLVMLPMWLLSGSFFSSKRFPGVTQPIIQALPLTQLNDALREVMLNGASLADVSTPILILTGWAVVTFALALKIFRWE